MKRTESVQTILTLAAKAAGKPLADYQKTDGFSEEQVKGLNMVPEKTLEALATLAAKSPADSIIQAKHNADTALAAHGHAMNTMDEADKAKAAKKAADAKAKEDAADDGKDDDMEDESGKKRAAAMKAAQAAGLTIEEYEEQEYLKTAPASIRAMAAEHKARTAERKATLVKALKGGKLTDKQLEAKPLEELETLASYAGVETEETADYSGRGLPRTLEDGSKDVFASPPNGYDIAIEKMRKTVN